MNVKSPLLFEDLQSKNSQLHYTTLLQAEARDRLTHWDDSGQVASTNSQVTNCSETGNNTLPEVCSTFCTFKFIRLYVLGLGVIFSCILLFYSCATFAACFFKIFWSLMLFLI